MQKPRPVPFRHLVIHPPPPSTAAPQRFAQILQRPERPKPEARPEPSAAGPAPQNQQPPAAEQNPDAGATPPPAQQQQEPQQPEAPSSAPPAPAPLPAPTPAPILTAAESEIPMRGILESIGSVEGVLSAPRIRTPPSAMPPALSAVADTVIEFCNAGPVAQDSDWKLRITLRQDLLPETNLELTLSPDWLHLRFSSHRHDSKALLFEHQHALHELLSERLERQREIRIAIE